MSGIHSVEPDGTIIYMPDDSNNYPRMKSEVSNALKWKRIHNEAAFDTRRIEPIYEYEDFIDPEGIWG